MTTPRILSLAAKILAILTIVTAVFTNNYALVVVAIVCGVAVVMFDYLKNLPSPVSLTAASAQNSSDFQPTAQFLSRQQIVASMQTPGSSGPFSHSQHRSLQQIQTPLSPFSDMSFHNHLQQTRWAATVTAATAANDQETSGPQHSTQRHIAKTQLLSMPEAAFPQDFDVNAMPVSRRNQFRNPYADDVVTLGDCIPPNETMESRVGRSVLLRQIADLPIPRGAQAEFNRTMLRLNPLPPAPNMQLVTPEELAREQMQAAPLFQRLPRRRRQPK
jgi:hypothetical protein